MRRLLLTACLVVCVISPHVRGNSGEVEKAAGHAANEQLDLAARYQQTLRHIERLEQAFRDAGLQIPARPSLLSADADGLPHGPLGFKPLPTLAAPEFPAGVQWGGLAGAVESMTAMDEDAFPAWLRRVRQIGREAGHPDHDAAAVILRVVGEWVETGVALAEARRDAGDAAACYAVAHQVKQLLAGDILGERFAALDEELKSHPDTWARVESDYALRLTLHKANKIGMLEGISHWEDSEAGAVREVVADLKRIQVRWRGTEAAAEAQAWIDQWAQEEQALRKAKPAWTYTWQLLFVERTGSQTVVIKVDKDGAIEAGAITDELDRYDRKRVRMVGTFQNRSAKAYAYTFNVGLSGKAKPDHVAMRLVGRARVQTPVLAPNELHQWSVDIAVPDIGMIIEGGLGGIEAVASEQ